MLPLLLILTATCAAALPQYPAYYVYAGGYPGYYAPYAAAPPGLVLPQQVPQPLPFQVSLRPALPTESEVVVSGDPQVLVRADVQQQSERADVITSILAPVGVDEKAGTQTDQSDRHFGLLDGLKVPLSKLDVVATASISGVVPTNGAQGTITFYQPVNGATPKVRVIGVVQMDAEGVRNLVVSVHENPDISSNCQNIGQVYNPKGFWLPDGGIITRTASTNDGGNMNFNIETVKLQGGVSSLAGRRSVAIFNNGVPIACGIIQPA